MAKEIERKFLVIDDTFKQGADKAYFHQGYLSVEPSRSVRIRIEGNIGKLTIKGLSKGFTRDEFEYEIPFEEAKYMLENMCMQPTIEKTRYKVMVGEYLWEIDEFRGDNAGLVMAEVELPSEDATFANPSWLGEEVTGDIKYYNASLTKYPYNQWSK